MHEKNVDDGDRSLCVDHKPVTASREVMSRAGHELRVVDTLIEYGHTPLSFIIHQDLRVQEYKVIETSKNFKGKQFI